ncbi:Fanconi anemia group J protein homolog isoform X2 [Chenopodium quinoa]|uniref:Fanconi anemia group J protein homolog isoform X2 n=1 Tax=Chenopodium quinoa TaxID=63459 RepID=UPI000B784AFE|nr:Fanconi anemia group J protein homolog isoform X2 [Chenopodium quinoa]
MEASTHQNPENPRNVYHIGGIPVEFPYKPYGSQLAFMGRVISTLDRAQKEGHCHALLESPTGTGKSLSLLCSALAWQLHRGKNPIFQQQHSKPDSRASSDPLNHGGGFVVDSQLSETSTPETAPPATNTMSQSKKSVPTIYYASRTHSQITQVIREYRKTTYRAPMAVLASRKHYCTNEKIRNGDNLDEECKLLLENKEAGCPQFKNAHRVKSHPSLQKGGCHEAHDIEDLVKIGKTVKGCSYFAARSLAGDAHIVFCPYSYITNPIIRRAMEIDIKGAILVLDEAHNIEDISREAGSVDVDEDALHKLQMELGQLCGGDALTYQPLYEMVQDVLSWMERRKGALEKRDFQRYVSCWTGDKALKELQEASISQQCFPILQECAAKAIKAASDTESGLAHLSGMSAVALEGLFCSLNYFFQKNGLHINDFQLAVQCIFKKDTGSWTLTFSLWCLNPAVVFRDITDLSLSVILTSGTLSPMNSFSSELGIPFGTLLEAPHVIDVESQVWASIISTGPHEYPLNASYKTADAYAFQDAVGKALEELFKVVPGGSLVFFPSYKLMDKLCKRWIETGQWSRMNARKPVFVEPRGGSQEDFEAVLKGYYSAIRPGTKPALGKRRKAKKVKSNLSTTANSIEESKEGAAFLAVCRGKVSEGIDFSDENARAVIIIGIPFPNINDIQVAEKKKYNDTYKCSKNLLSGSDWYCQQAFRALNQAAGRCIRHRHDYGAIIFLDERFREERNTIYISKWLRKSIRTYENFETSVEGLKSFFCNIKERVGNTIKLQDPVADLEGNLPDASVKESIRLKTQKSTNSQVSEMGMVSGSMKMPSTGLSHCLSRKAGGISDHTTIRSQRNNGIQEPLSTHVEDIDNQKEIDKDCYSLECCETLCTANFEERLELSVVKETPMAGDYAVSSPEPFMNEDNSYSTIIQASEFDQAHHVSLTDSAQSPSKVTCAEVTPERIGRGNTKELTQEVESSANLSVNSHAQKKRMLLNTQQMNTIQKMKFDVVNAENSQDFRMMNYSELNDNSSQRTKFSKVSLSACELKPSAQPSVVNEGNISSKCGGFCMDQLLQIFCSLCKNPLGLPENSSYVTCFLTSLSKIILSSLSKGHGPQSLQTSPSLVPVLIVDILSVDQRLYNRNNKDIPGQGIWCQEDGCVYNSIFCPFCISTNHCLGVQIMAADALNTQLIGKILFYYDRLEVKTCLGSESKDSLIDNNLCRDQTVGINSIKKYEYQSQQHSPGSWKLTKGKSRLLKRSPMSQS